jgi:hypothetical protein
MAQSSRPKQPLDVLQSMINAIVSLNTHLVRSTADNLKLIEVGKALRASDKEGGRTLANSNTRLRSFFPSAIDNFHQTLDDLECDIVRSQRCLQTVTYAVLMEILGSGESSILTRSRGVEGTATCFGEPTTGSSC